MGVLCLPPVSSNAKRALVVLVATIIKGGGGGGGGGGGPIHSSSSTPKVSSGFPMAKLAILSVSTLSPLMT
jgi:hypothetical protein